MIIYEIFNISPIVHIFSFIQFEKTLVIFKVIFLKIIKILISAKSSIKFYAFLIENPRKFIKFIGALLEFFKNNFEKL